MTPKIQAGEWVKGKLIGSGSFGHVHIAMKKSNGYIFIVKSSHFEAGIKSLENEAEILLKLKNSPYVVQYHGKETTRGPNNERVLNIFLEHMGAGSVFDVIDKFGGKLYEEAIRSYTRQLLLGINDLHEKGVVHCDVKCKNVLLDSHGNLKLADFGCAITVNDLIHDDTNTDVLQRKQYVAGTPLWMAPEVLRGKELPSKAADIWSLGCTIIEMATGKPPNWGDDVTNPMSIILNIVNSKKKPEFPSELSQEGLHFLEMCFQRNPRQRPTARELLRHPFVLSNNPFKDVTSPASVLDIQSFDMNFSDEDIDDDESSDDVYDVLPSAIELASINNYHVVRNALHGSYLKSQTILETSEDWITVRSIE